MEKLDLKGLLRCYLLGKVPEYEALPSLDDAPATLRTLNKTIVQQIPKAAARMKRRTTDSRVSDWLERLGEVAEEDLRGRS